MRRNIIKYSFFRLLNNLGNRFNKSVSYKIIAFLAIIFSSYTYSQEIEISGLENIHISKGTVIVTQNPESSKVEYITQNSDNKNREKTVVCKLKKQKITFADKEKIVKKIDEKLIKKIKQKQNLKIVYNTNSNSNSSFSASSIESKIAFNSNNTSLSKYIAPQSSFISFLYFYQEKQNILYKFYKSKSVENFLFTRPPPKLYS